METISKIGFYSYFLSPLFYVSSKIIGVVSIAFLGCLKLLLLICAHWALRFMQLKPVVKKLMVADGVSSFLESDNHLYSISNRIISETKTRVYNQPGFWIIMKCFFHITMVSSYIIGSILSLGSRELWIWTYFYFSFLEKPISQVYYLRTLLQAYFVLMLSTFGCKHQYSKRKKIDRFAFCQSYMMLSCCMHCQHWTGYLQKFGCEPILLSSYFHQMRPLD